MTPPTHARILVLDREGERQGVLVEAVTRAGGEAILAHTAAEARDLLDTGQDPLAALLLGELPDGCAPGFVASARPHFPDLAIVAVATQTGQATDLYHAGADTVTTPPLDPDLLGAKLTGALRRTQARHAAED